MISTSIKQNETMKRHFILIGFMLMASMSNAQETAGEFIKRVINQLNSHQNYEITFDYEVGNSVTTVSEKESGKATLQGEAYKLEIADQQIISDGKTLWTYLIEDEEVMVGNATDESLITPIKMLTTYDKNYSMKYVKQAAKGKKCIEMLNPQGEFKRITLTIDEKKLEIEKAKIELQSGDEMVVTINSYSYDKKLDANFFIFNEKEHKNVDVIDMR